MNKFRYGFNRETENQFMNEFRYGFNRETEKISS